MRRPFLPSACIAALGGRLGLCAFDRAGDRTRLPTSGTDAVFQGADARHVVTVEAAGARCAVPADIDDDGHLDIVSVSSNDNTVAWYKQLPDGTYGAKNMISRASNGARIVTVGDIDQDNRTDVIVASYYDHTVGWFQNLGGGKFGPMQMITRTAISAQGVSVFDLDNDGDLDVLSASSGDNTVAWYENLGGGIFCEIKRVVDSNSIGVRTVVAADIDGDGFLDLAVASKDDNTVAWYRNDGQQNFSKRIIDDTAGGAYSLVAEDVDKDGLVDLVVAANAAGFLPENNEGGLVYFYRNSAYPNGTSGLFLRTAVTAGNSSGANDFDWFVLSVWAGDLDRDGDIDIASASFSLLHRGGISWYENVDGAGSTWLRHKVYETQGSHAGHYVIGADMDSDGDTDLLAVTNGDNTVQILTAVTACDGSRASPQAACCTDEQWWDGAACVSCRRGTFLNTSGVCEECAATCPRAGLGYLPKACHSMPSCGDVAASFARCDCGPGAFLGGAGVCAKCPDGQITLGDRSREPGDHAMASRSFLDGTTFSISDLSWHGFNSSRCLIPSCPAGAYFDTKLLKCEVCAGGTFSSGGSVTACVRCPEGSECPVGAELPIPCQAGNYSGEGAEECLWSPPGWYTQVSGMAAPVPCAAGVVAPEAGSVECRVCEIGYYAGESNMTECASCAEGRSAPQLWTTMKEVVVDGARRWVYAERASSRDRTGEAGVGHCTCDVGGRMSSGECIPCEEGLLCEGGHGPPQVLRGFHAGVREHLPAVAFVGVQGEYSVFRCIDARWCPGGAVGTCTKGREGIGCAECKAMMFAGDDGACYPCGATSWFPLVAFCVITSVAVITLVVWMDSDKVYTQQLTVILISTTLALLISSMQQFSVLGSLDVAWVEPVRTLIEALSLLSFDFHILRVSCVVGMSPFSKYMFKLLVLAAVVVLILITFVVVVLLKHKGRFAHRSSTLVGVLGSVFTVFLITIMQVTFAPVNCTKNPNGLYVMRALPMVVCNESPEHTGMLVAGLTASNMPLGFITAVCWATWQYPKRMMTGDAAFNRAFHFIAVRYRPDSTWYSVVFILRSAIISLTPLINDPLVQVILMVTIFGFANLLQTRFFPWRVHVANVLDSAMMGLMILFLVAASFFMDNVDLSGVAWLCSVLLLLSLSLAVAISIYGMVRLCVQQSHWTFDFFICHHKAAAAAQARWMKILLQAKAQARVFIDSDDLNSLDNLFDIVGTQVRHLVLYLTKDTLTRPWCAGEYATAVRNRLRITAVICPGWVAPTTDEMTNLPQYLDLQSTNLMQFGITFEMVGFAFAKLQDKGIRKVELSSGGLGRHRFEHAVNGVMRRNLSARSTPSLVRSGGIVVSCDDESNEAAAASAVLISKLARCSGTLVPAGICLLPEVESWADGDATVVREAGALVLVMSQDSLTSIPQLTAVIESFDRMAKIVLVTLPNFSFPGPAYYKDVLPRIWSGDLAPLRTALTTYLRQISIALNTHASDELLQTQCNSVAERLEAPGRVSLQQKARASLVASPTEVIRESSTSTQSEEDDFN